jgi:hypothetical protein
MVSRHGEIVSRHGEIFFFLHVPNTLRTKDTYDIQYGSTWTSEKTPFKQMYLSFSLRSI